MSTVLMLDDDKVFQAVVTQLLTAKGIAVHCFSRASDAESFLLRSSVQLAIIDGLLPDQSGLEFISRNRSLLVRVPLVFCSAFWRDMGSHRQLEQLGVRAVLRKPVSGRQMVDTVESLLAAQASTAQSVG